MSTEITYDNIDRPYDSQLSRIGASSNKAGQPSFGNEQTNQYSNISAGAGGTSVTSGNMLGDMWITTFIRSKNWKPKERGFTINGAEGYAEFANVHISGELTASSGIIGGFTITSDELYSIADGNKTSLSSGFIAFSVGPEGHPTATILQSGKASFADIDITGGSISDATLDSLKAGSMPSIQGWTSDLVFSATNNTTVEWAAGDIELVDGTTYAIVAGNTGVMAASTYIYIDIDVSVTVLQKTTTASDSVGGGKILVAVAKNVTGVTKDATFQVFGGAGGISSFIGIENIPDDEITAAVIADNTITAGQILANTITSGEIAANTIEAGQIKANTITASEIAANTVTSNEIAANTITASEIAATTITAAQIVAGTITATQLAADSVTATKIDVTSLSAVSATMGTLNLVNTTVGSNVRMDATDRRVEWLYNNSVEGYLYVNAAGQFFIDADSFAIIRSDGSGDDVKMLAGHIATIEIAQSNGQIQLDAASVSSSSISMGCSDYFQHYECDDYSIYFNTDDTDANCSWIDDHDSDRLMKLDSENENLYIDGEFKDTGADFAEYFESEDGKEIAPGISVFLVGDKIRVATQKDIPIGVISANPTIVGNSGGVGCDSDWGGKYLKNIFGKAKKEEKEYWSMRKVKKNKNKDNFGKRAKVDRPTKGEKGGINHGKETRTGWSEEQTPPKGAEKKMSMRKIINPEWDEKRPYISREKRPEWNIVGLLGRVPILKGQPIAATWIKLREISNTVDEYLIK